MTEYQEQQRVAGLIEAQNKAIALFDEVSARG